MNSGSAADLKAIALRTINAKDCRAFITQLNDYAVDCSRQSDDLWIADKAGLRILDDAIDWYADLDVETQESWKKLRRALLKEIKSSSKGSSLSNSSTAPAPAALVPRPAAAPEGVSSIDLATRIARIRVEAADPQYSGYLSGTLSDSEGRIWVTTDTCDALTVQYNPNDDFPILKVTNPGYENAALGIHWASNLDHSSRYFCTGHLVVVDQKPPTTSSWTTADGPSYTAAFFLLPSSSMLVFSSVSSDRYLLDTFLERG